MDVSTALGHLGRPMSTKQNRVMITTVYHEANSNARACSLIIKHVTGSEFYQL